MREQTAKEWGLARDLLKDTADRLHRINDCSAQDLVIVFMVAAFVIAENSGLAQEEVQEIFDERMKIAQGHMPRLGLKVPTVFG